MPLELGPDVTDTRPLEPNPLRPVDTLTSPLPPPDEPVVKEALPLERANAVTEPVLRRRIPEPLEAPPPVRTLMKPPEDDELDELEEPASTTMLPPSLELLAPLVKDSWPPEPPTDEPALTTTLPEEPDTEEPVLTLTLPLRPAELTPLWTIT
jgi:hypothetical protein